jgi:hypothetical protein
MRKYARVKSDGYVMNFSVHMSEDTRKSEYDFFETDKPVPEFIDDLPAFLAGKSDGGAKPIKSRKAEPVFLKDSAGNVVA